MRRKKWELGYRCRSEGGVFGKIIIGRLGMLGFGSGGKRVEGKMGVGIIGKWVGEEMWKSWGREMG